MKILIATTNKGKYQEIKHILSEVFTTVEVISLNEITKVPREPKETGKTFLENALIKAKYYFSYTKIPVISEDSGLMIDALDGKPGIYSARYAGENSTQETLIKKVLEEMNGKSNRSARFVCVMVFMYDKNKYIFSEGKVEGLISYEPRGKNGFGYDPIFIPLGHEKTFAEMLPEEKNKISHRYNALVNLIVKMKSI